MPCLSPYIFLVKFWSLAIYEELKTCLNTSDFDFCWINMYTVYLLLFFFYLPNNILILSVHVILTECRSCVRKRWWNRQWRRWCIPTTTGTCRDGILRHLERSRFHRCSIHPTYSTHRRRSKQARPGLSWPPTCIRRRITARSWKMLRRRRSAVTSFLLTMAFPERGHRRAVLQRILVISVLSLIPPQGPESRRVTAVLKLRATTILAIRTFFQNLTTKTTFRRTSLDLANSDVNKHLQT